MAVEEAVPVAEGEASMFGLVDGIVLAVIVVVVVLIVRRLMRRKNNDDNQLRALQINPV